ncbi:immunoglobulin superfamily member 2-like [Cebidichthys violaceus]|uniref:immunoglobulin superfamily member 2-like n=1 Tax=Cebidichthys violaceus TaxID=271503 RepID=UPI0035CC31DF
MFKFYALLVPVFGAYGALLYAKPGHNVTLPCFYVSSANNLCWYKQVAGEQPQIIASFYKHLPNSNIFYNQFKDNKRFSVHTDAGFYQLNISNVQDSDSAMYYCGHTSVAVTEFENGTFLVLKDSSRRSFLLQPASDSVKAGGSVTLNCTVHTGTSDTEHSVYWFKKEDSRNSHLGIMYIHRHISGQCVQSLQPPAQSCVHSLSKTNVSRSDAGTYYCAVASCAEILFGNGTRLEVGEQQGDIFPLLMKCSVAALLVSGVLNVILIGILCKMSRRKYLHSCELQPHLSVPEADSQNEESDAPQYVALDFKKRHGKSRRQGNPEEETIYAGVRLSDLK